MINKYFYVSAWVGIASAVVLILVTGFWLIYPYKPAVYNNLPQKVDKTSYKAGDQLFLEIDFCRYSPIVPEIRRSFVNGVVYNLHSTVSPTDDIGCFIRNVGITVPSTLNPGTYHINTNFRYRVNPIREIEIIVESEHFEVTR